MTFATTAFGDVETWGPRLRWWIERFRAHMPTEQLCVVTDRASEWWVCPFAGVEADVLTVDARSSFAPFIYRGNLIVASLEQLAPVLFVDLDCETRAEIPPDEMDLADVDFGMVRDVSGRNWVEWDTQNEMNGGVMMFGTAEAGERFLEVQDYPHPKRKRLAWWDQICWSRVWHDMERDGRDVSELPVLWNHSHWLEDVAGIVWKHYHGNDGSRKIWG